MADRVLWKQMLRQMCAKGLLGVDLWQEKRRSKVGQGEMANPTGRSRENTAYWKSPIELKWPGPQTTSYSFLEEQDPGSLQLNQILPSVCCVDSLQWNGKSFIKDGSEQLISVCRKVQPIGRAGEAPWGQAVTVVNGPWETLGEF